MARKNLLTESEIRSFMKLANLKQIRDPEIKSMSLTEGYGGMGAALEEDDIDAAGDLEGELPPEVEDELDFDGEADDMEVEDDGGLSSMTAEELVTIAADALAALAQQAGVDVDVEDDTDDMGMDDEPMGDEPMDDELPMDDEPVMEGDEENLEEFGGGASQRPTGSPKSRMPKRPKAFGGSGGATGPNLTGRDPEMLPATDPSTDPKPRGKGPRKGPRPGSSGPKLGGFSEGRQEALVAEVAKRVAARLQGDQNKQELIENLTERILNRLTK